MNTWNVCDIRFGDIIVQCMGPGERYMNQVEGLLYSRLGIGIKLVMDAWHSSIFESLAEGVPWHSTASWESMLESMRAFETQIQTAEDFELEMACHTERDGTPYYTPLQYLCVLNKMWKSLPWTSEVAEQLSLRGASHAIPHFWDVEMKAHATRMFTRMKSGGPRS